MYKRIKIICFASFDEPSDQNLEIKIAANVPTDVKIFSNKNKQQQLANPHALLPNNVYYTYSNKYRSLIFSKKEALGIRVSDKQKFFAYKIAQKIICLAPSDSFTTLEELVSYVPLIMAYWIKQNTSTMSSELCDSIFLRWSIKEKTFEIFLSWRDMSEILELCSTKSNKKYSLMEALYCHLDELGYHMLFTFPYASKFYFSKCQKEYPALAASFNQYETMVADPIFDNKSFLNKYYSSLSCMFELMRKEKKKQLP